MKKLFFILTAFLLYSASVRAEFDCASLTDVPLINFTTSYGKLEYDFSKSNQEITAIASHYGIVEKGIFASGLSTINVSWEISLNTLGKIYGDTDICVVPTHITIFIGYLKPKIYVSSQLEPNSCEYNVVLRHEQTHQQINKTALDYFLPMFQKAIKQIIAATPALHVTHITEIDRATNQLTSLYNKKITPLVEAFKNELLIEQSKLDNHNNYQHEKELCLKPLY